MRWGSLAAFLCLFGWIGDLGAQTTSFSVTGRVIERRNSRPVSGATLRLSDRQVYITGADGGFSFSGLSPGDYTLRVEAMGYRSLSLPMAVQRDTTVLVELEIDPIRIDSLFVDAGTFNLRGKVLDGTTGRGIPEARVRTGRAPETYSRTDGSFRIKNLPRASPIPVQVDAYRYLPARDTLLSIADTTLNISIEPDSVGIRLFEVAGKEMEIRSRGVDLPRIQLSRDYIERRMSMRLTDMLRVRTRGRVSTKCLFIDDVNQPYMEVLDTYQLSELERIEVFGRGAMIRIYTQDYVARNLTRVRDLPPIVYVTGGICW